MVTRIPSDGQYCRASFRSSAALLISFLVMIGCASVVHAASPGSSGTPPSVDIAYKLRHPPGYPASAAKKGEQGTVMLEVTIDATGKVTDVQVDPRATNAPASLQLAAVSAAKTWKYHPGSKDGNPVGGVVQVPAKFSLQKCSCSRPAQAAASSPSTR